MGRAQQTGGGEAGGRRKGLLSRGGGTPARPACIIHSSVHCLPALLRWRRRAPMVTVWQLGRQEWLRAAAAGNSPMPASWEAPSAPTPCSRAKRRQQHWQ